MHALHLSHSNWQQAARINNRLRYDAICSPGVPDSVKFDDLRYSASGRGIKRL